ncbi:hypothetical protein EON63_21535 [archaeon]|nr:MAG: hypothetical protein EON63_21535 [archaeon]
MASPKGEKSSVGATFENYELELAHCEFCKGAVRVWPAAIHSYAWLVECAVLGGGSNISSIYWTANPPLGD